MICQVHGDVALSLRSKVFDRQRLPFFRTFGRKLTPVLEQAGKVTAQAALRGGTSKAVAAVAARELNSKLPKVYADLYRQVIAAFGERASEISPKDWNPESVALRAWVRAQTAKNISNVAKATRLRVRKIILQGLEAERGLDDIAKNIRNSYHFSNRRAFRIARTEVVAASNAGNHYGTIQNLPNNGKDFQKVWSSSGDTRVRDTHIRVSPVAANALFRLPGGSLMFPGDSTHGAKASEIVNCRCTSLFRRVRGKSL